MRAEIAKLRYLPLPRWTAVAVLAAAVIAGFALIAFRPDSSSTYTEVPSTVLDSLNQIALMVLGVWIATLEFSSGTLQRTLTAESRRTRVLTAKLVVLIVAALILLVVSVATLGGLIHFAAIENDVDIDKAHLVRTLFGTIPVSVAFALIGFGFGLLLRSMGGGITVALAFTFVISGVVSLAPHAAEYTVTQFSNDLSNHLTGNGATVHGWTLAAIGTLGWCLIVIVPGWIKFLRDDLK
ncbi:ABC transporter permease subunit [Nocardia sp. 348MFTsu5.1]|uniref:ABC transporter permease subunit n=1 Tax=Nocardia sp. 348MFTsu5.1 TaxID=1172185 RepID=UPI00036CCB5E|nr:ABC transporter permease subunit [Nocardia sp. 348MFTsu5.1]